MRSPAAKHREAISGPVGGDLSVEPFTIERFEIRFEAEQALSTRFTILKELLAYFQT
jgi:hypothetical protein